MVTVTVHPDSAAAPASFGNADKSVDITDTTGRTITLKKPGVLAEYELIDGLGDSARNQTYLSMVMPLIFVTAIGGAPVATPGTKAEVKALIKQLDDAGITAVMEGVAEYFTPADPDAAIKK